MADKPQSHTIPRDLLEKYFDKDPRLISHFEDQGIAVAAVIDATSGTVSATDSLVNATVVTLSTNAVFNNEFVLTAGDGMAFDVTEGLVTIKVNDSVARTIGGAVTFSSPGNVSLTLPSDGTLISDTEPATLFNKTIDKSTLLPNLGNYAVQADAAAAGVPLWGLFRDGTVLHVRTV